MRLPQDRILHIDTELAGDEVRVVMEWQGELVRCEDCDRGFGSPVCPIQSQGWAINTDTFFCAWGERREP